MVFSGNVASRMIEHSRSTNSQSEKYSYREIMNFMPQTKFLNRFTTLPVLLDMLSRRCITLLEPTTWEDKNDSYYLEKYKMQRKLKTLLACCFSAKHETFHHWKVFSNGSSGVCIEFNAEKLLNTIESINGIQFRMVSYRLLKYNQNPSLGAWPFLKRKAFEDEEEFRIIYEDSVTAQITKALPIDLEWIQKITLSPWMPKAVAESVIKVIHGIKDCEAMTVNYSTLLQSEVWKNSLWG
jgi:hypothetical protein